MTNTVGGRPDAVEELHFRSHKASLCALVNHRTKMMRVIDYRSGALPEKRLFIQNAATREGVRKVVALVEKDEVGPWTKVGFTREGTIPGFYKRSDGYLLGCVFGGDAVPSPGELGKRADRTLTAAKKVLKEQPHLVAVTTKPVPRSQALSARDAAWKVGPQVGAFDGFGRDACDEYLSVTPKQGGKANYLGAQVEECFGHAMIEVLRSPENPAEMHAIYVGLAQLVEELTARSVVSGFAFAPIDDGLLAQAFLAAGFRKSGVLADGRAGQDATILFSRKLANPDREAAAS